MASCWLGLAVLSCGDEDTDPVPVDETSWYRGQVEQGSGYIGAPAPPADRAVAAPVHLAGATITVEELHNDGLFVDVTRDTALSDADGHFLVSARVANAANLVVKAVKGDRRYRSLVTRPTPPDSTTVVAPLNDETTAEAEVLALILAGPERAVASPVDVRLFVNSSVAALLGLIPSYVMEASTPLAGASAAQRAVLTNPVVGATPAALGTVEAARRQAAMVLEAALDAASEMDPQTTGAYTAFFAAERAAWVGGGVPLHRLALAREAAGAEMARRAAPPAPDAMKQALGMGAALQRARTTTAAVNDAMLSAGAPASARTAVANAGETLRLALYSLGTDTGFRAAFATYATGVSAALMTGYPDQAAAIGAADAAIRASGGPRAALVTGLAAANSAAGVAAVHVSYAVAAESAALAPLTASTLPGAARLPLARMLTMLAMAV